MVRFGFCRNEFTMKRAKSFIHDYLFKLLIFTFLLLIFINLPRRCYGNNNIQHHHRGDESPSFQYSQGGNNPYFDVSPIHDIENLWNWLYTGLSNNFLTFAKKKDGSLSVWTQALGSTLLISAAPFLILFFVPIDPSQEKQSTLKILLSFASGGLLGDSFLHLIPHSLGSHAHAHTHHHHHQDHDQSDASHSHISHASDVTHSHDKKATGGASPMSSTINSHGHVGLFVLLGIVAFLVVEKSVRLVNKAHNHSRNAENKKKDVAIKDSKDSKKGNNSKKQKQKEMLSVAGYLNLAADFTHNLTDGLAIGASYLAGKHIGFVTTLTILLHEVPHEIGDFAILIQSGCSRKKAMGLQLLTALGAVIGTFIALMADGAGDIASTWILPFTAGGFIYISTVSILPELLEDSNFLQSLKEIVAMLVGVLLMVVIADFE